MNLEKFTSLLAGIIIPRENDKALSGSDVEFYKFMKKYKKLSLLENYKKNIEISYKKQTGDSLYKKNHIEIANYIVKTKRKNYRLINEISVLLCECYYSNIEALKKINLPTNPPFPDGNIIQNIDLSILEDVYNRGKKYRDI